ncbi:hypothetical protein NDU88_001121 [Pleurodeles waltl]|uniref:Uncharacterized protein n=1 Tax=Pleurodeles waltl TaxID=8319 RepID=A0AAV7VAZ6_PLEWA|nr:hypothetical protein NDU88_001121 [Pleurodeles waltl]
MKGLIFLPGKENPTPGRDWENLTALRHTDIKGKVLRSVETEGEAHERLLAPDAQIGKCRSDASEAVGTVMERSAREGSA